MKSRLIAVAIHKRVICGNVRFAPKAAFKGRTERDGGMHPWLSTLKIPSVDNRREQAQYASRP